MNETTTTVHTAQNFLTTEQLAVIAKEMETSQAISEEKAATAKRSKAIDKMLAERPRRLRKINNRPNDKRIIGDDVW